MKTLLTCGVSFLLVSCGGMFGGGHSSDDVCRHAASVMERKASADEMEACRKELAELRDEVGQAKYDKFTSCVMDSSTLNQMRTCEQDAK